MADLLLARRNCCTLLDDALVRVFDNISNEAITWTDENNRLVFDEKGVGFHLWHFLCDLRRNGVELNILRHLIANSFGSIGLRLRNGQVL